MRPKLIHGRVGAAAGPPGDTPARTAVLGLAGGVDVVPALRSLSGDDGEAFGLGPVGDCADAATADIRRRAGARG